MLVSHIQIGVLIH